MAGNANSGPKREKPFLQALNMELAAAGTDHKALRRIAAQLIAKAWDGDMQAIVAIADRTDGRPSQQVQVSGDEDNPLHHVIERRIVDPKQ